MTHKEALKLALECAERCESIDGMYSWADTITAIKEALSSPNGEAQPEQKPKCNPHPKAPHGFNRNASHANDRYTCECESWDAYDAGYQAGVMAGIEASMGQEPEHEPVAVKVDDASTGTVYVKFLVDECLLPVGTQFYTAPPQRKEPEQEYDWKDLYEKEKRRSAMWLAKYEEVAGPAPKAYPLAQPEQEPVATLDDLEQEIYENTRQFVSRDFMEWMLKRYYTTPPQRTWVGLTDYQIEMTWFKHHDAEGYLRNPNQEGWAYEKELMDKLKEKNT